MKKYKLDIIIISVIALIAIIAIVILNVTAKKDNLVAIVYHNDEIVLTVELDELENEQSYVVNGDISEVTIIASKEGVRIVESECSDHTCIHQGLITNTNQSLTCLPNKIYIILQGNNEMDVII